MYLMSQLRLGVHKRLIITLLLSSLVSAGLFVARAIDAGNNRYAFLLWNLFLAWVPLVLAWWLVRRLEQSSWLNAPNLIITALWLGFLPNSFYLVSDLIHLHTTGEVGLLYDAVMFFSFISNAYVVGYMSLFLVHKALLGRVRRRDAHIIAGLVLLACSFAIYLGRYLRWNTWDVLVNPAGILFDVSDRFINPAADPQFFVTTVTFFVALSSLYAVIWQLLAANTTPNRAP
jgi:uncharacterized membrane protein